MPFSYEYKYGKLDEFLGFYIKNMIGGITIYKNILKYLLTFLVPFAVLFIVFRISTIAGFALVVIYLIAIFVLALPSIYKLQGAKVYGREDNIEEAIKWYEKAYKTGRADTGTGVSLAYLMLKTGDMEKSEALFKKIYEASSTSEDFRNIIKSNIALIKWKKGKLDEAIEMMEKLVADFKTTNIYGSLGFLYIEKGDFEKALEFNKEANEYNNSNSIIMDNLGETYYWLERYDEAEETYVKLMEKEPKFPEPYYHYGLVLEKLDKKDEAFKMFKKADTFKINFLSTITKEQITEKLSDHSEKKHTEE